MALQTAYSITDKEARLLDYITCHIEAKSSAPTYADMADHLGLRSKSGVYRLVIALEERGRIVRLANRTRTITLPRDNDDRCVTIPADLSEDIRASASARSITPAQLIERAYRLYVAKVRV